MKITTLKSIFRRIYYLRESICYYCALALVLTALGSAAYHYRNPETLPPEEDEYNETQVVEVRHAADPTLAPQPEPNRYKSPIEGEIVTPYSETELHWSNAFQMWQTHPAIDIAAADGEAVTASADGVVIDAYEDPMYGKCITIDHGEGELVCYGSLNTLRLVSIGQEVRQGEVIGSAGHCEAESSLGAHVHLEYSVNGSSSDFSEFVSREEHQNLQE